MCPISWYTHDCPGQSYKLFSSMFLQQPLNLTKKGGKTMNSDKIYSKNNPQISLSVGDKKIKFTEKKKVCEYEGCEVVLNGYQAAVSNYCMVHAEYCNEKQIRRNII